MVTDGRGEQGQHRHGTLVGRAAGDLRRWIERYGARWHPWRNALFREHAARVEAEAANAAKDRLLAVVSHELRNPLAAILAGVEAIRRLTAVTDPGSSPGAARSASGDPAGAGETDGVSRAEAVARVLAAIERSARLQARLIEDLMDLSRIATGNLQLRRGPVSLEHIVAAAVYDQQAAATAAGLTLVADLDPDLWVFGDADRIHQMVTNLITNAVKFTPSGGTIRARAWEAPAGAADGCPATSEGESSSDPAAIGSPRRAYILVEDTGIGIDPDALGEVFGMFWQGEPGRAHPGSLGIGLSLVESIARMHGGRVWAESDGVGKGSRFIVELPLLELAGNGESPPPAHTGQPPRTS